MSEPAHINFGGEAWVWTMNNGRKPGRWYFVTIDGEAAAELKLASLGLTAGFGSVRVRVTIGGTAWRTSVFPHRDSGGWILPLKAAVRKSEGIEAGQVIEGTLVV